MKKTTLSLSLVFGMIFSFCITSYCKMTPENINSIYVNENSWIIEKLEEKMKDLYGKGITPINDKWKKCIGMAYVCVDTGMPSDNKIDSVLYGGHLVSLNMPIEIKEMSGLILLEGFVRFKKPVDSLLDAINSTIAPEKDEEYEIEINGVAPSDYSFYINDFKQMDKKQEEAAKKFGFIFDKDTKIYAAGMDRYTYGYILKDTSNNKLFWCKESVQTFEKENFYRLEDVLNGFRDYVQSSHDHSYYYAH